MTESISGKPLHLSGAWTRASVLLVLSAAVFLVSLFTGSSELTFADVAGALSGAGNEAARSIVLEVRLPRLVAAFAVGGLLALAGVLLQALFRNPLADPYVLGVSGGAAVAALFAMMVSGAMFVVQSAAVGGALAAVVIVYMLGRGGGTARLLLTGVVLASASGALVSVLLAIADSSRVRGMVFWLAGDLSWASRPLASGVTLLLALAVALILARPLNVLAAGELRARSVGLDFDTWRTAVFLGAALLTAVAVVSAGTIGFVGLITPHITRLLFRTSDHRVVAPVAALLGGTLLAAADLVARTVASPRQLPVGAIMALVGAPLFLFLLRRSSRTR